MRDRAVDLHAAAVFLAIDTRHEGFGRASGSSGLKSKPRLHLRYSTGTWKAAGVCPPHRDSWDLSPSANHSKTVSGSLYKAYPCPSNFSYQNELPTPSLSQSSQIGFMLEGAIGARTQRAWIDFNHHHHLNGTIIPSQSEPARMVTGTLPDTRTL